MLMGKYKTKQHTEVYIHFTPDLEKETAGKEAEFESPIHTKFDIMEVLENRADDNFMDICGVVVRKKDIAYIDFCYDEDEARERFRYYEFEFGKGETETDENGEESKTDSDLCGLQEGEVGTTETCKDDMD